MSETFEWDNILVKCRPDVNWYQTYDTLLGQQLGLFQFDEGPGWVFIAVGGLIMDELPALADFWQELQAISLEDMGVSDERSASEF